MRRGMLFHYSHCSQFLDTVEGNRENLAIIERNYSTPYHHALKQTVLLLCMFPPLMYGTSCSFCRGLNPGKCPPLLQHQVSPGHTGREGS